MVSASHHSSTGFFHRSVASALALSVILATFRRMNLLSITYVIAAGTVFRTTRSKIVGVRGLLIGKVRSQIGENAFFLHPRHIEQGLGFGIPPGKSETNRSIRLDGQAPT